MSDSPQNRPENEATPPPARPPLGSGARLLVSALGGLVVCLLLFGAMAFAALLILEGRSDEQIPIVPLFGDFEEGSTTPTPDFLR